MEVLPHPLPVLIDRLENGLRIVTIEMPHLQGAAVCAYVRVGSRFESKADNGLSHFLEHMMFRGTRRLPGAYRINHAVEEIGGTLYAETRRDASLYQIGLPCENVPAGISLLGEILRDPAFTDIEVERRIILEEMQEDLDERGEEINLGDLVCGAAWSGHALGQKITGTMANVRRFTEDDLRRHYLSFYGAQNMVLCVAGAVSRQEVHDRAKEALATLPQGSQPDVVGPAPYPPNTGARRVHKDGDAGAQTSLSLAFRCEGELSPEYPALALLSRILDDGMSTRLYQRVVNELGLAYHCGGGLDVMVDTGLFEMEATATHVSVPLVIKEMLDLCSELRTHPVPADELHKAQKRYRWDVLSLRDDAAAMGEAFGRPELYYPPLSLEARLARVFSLTPDDLLRAAQRVLVADNMTVTTVGRLSSRLKGQVMDLLESFRQHSWVIPT